MKPVISAIMFSLILLIAACSCQETGNFNANTSPLREPLMGKQLPPLELPAYYRGKITRVNLGNYRGQWLILFFYPGDFTFVCPTELKELAEYYKELKNMGEVVSISTDSIFVHRAWHRQDKSVGTVTFPMLSDPGGAWPDPWEYTTAKRELHSGVPSLSIPTGKSLPMRFTTIPLEEVPMNFSENFQQPLRYEAAGGILPGGMEAGG